MYNVMNHRLHLPRPIQILSVLAVAALLAGCKTAPQPGTFAPRKGDEIVIAGQFVHTGTRVVLWMDPGGYDAYRVERRFSPFDVCGTSRQCFKVLHDGRGLSVHFMLDLDGTVYQTLDLKERAWHATTSNSRSVGIEIANMGAYPVNGSNPFAEWYAKDSNGKTRITIPAEYGDGGLLDRKSTRLNSSHANI